MNRTDGDLLSLPARFANMSNQPTTENLASTEIPAQPPPQVPGPPRPTQEPEFELDPCIGVVDVLSESERTDLLASEAIVEEGLSNFVQVGLALGRIRDRELYRTEFESFAAYYQAKWNFQHAHVHNLIKAAQLFSKLSAGSPKPDHLSQVRPLLSLEPDSAQNAWQHAATLSHGRKVTARIVKRAMKDLHLNTKSSAGKTGTRQERSAQREAITGLIGDLMRLISQNAAPSLLLERVEVLNSHFQRLFALDRKHKRNVA